MNALGLDALKGGRHEIREFHVTRSAHDLRHYRYGTHEFRS
jgi:hypothetical protein